MYNRTPSKAIEFSKTYHVEHAQSIGELAKKSRIIVTVLLDDDAVKKVCSQLSDVIAPGQIVVEMSTITPLVSIELARSFSMKGARLLDAPVLGTPLALRNGSASIVVGGDANAFNDVNAILEGITKNVAYIGENGSGLHCKLMNNLLVASYLIALDEAVDFGLGEGLKTEVIEKILTSFSSARTPISTVRVPNMLKGVRSNPSTDKNIRKDTMIIESEAERMKLKLPLTRFTAGMYRE